MCAWFPTKQTLLKAIKKGLLASWPGLIAKAVQQNFPELEETLKGHKQKSLAGLRSTKVQVINEEDNEDETDGKQETRPQRMYKDIMTKVIDIQDKLRQNIYTDQT